MKIKAVVWLAACAAACAAASPTWRDPSAHRVRFVTVDHEVRLEDLDRARLLQQPVTGAIDEAHAPGPEPLAEVVRTERA